MIELGKHYRTRDGKYRTDNDTLRVLMVDGKGMYPIICAFFVGGEQWEPRTYTSDGEFISDGSAPSYDLIEIKPRRKGEVWVNCYPESESIHCVPYHDRLTADDKAWGEKRIACVRVEFEYEEGEGL